MNAWLLRHGAALLMVVGVLLGISGIPLDRDPLVVLGVGLFALGVLLPRVEGLVEIGPAGLKVPLVSLEKVEEHIRRAGLSPDETAKALAKAGETRSVVIEAPPVKRETTFTADAIIVELGTAVEEDVANQIIASVTATGYGNNISEGYGSAEAVNPEAPDRPSATPD